LRWQTRLFEEMVKGGMPNVCDLPTGLGKTSVIPIWLIALAAQGEKGRPTLPRRLAYIVNRRTVVDQATDLVTSMRARLSEPESTDGRDRLGAIRSALVGLSASKDLPLAVSTLRGGLADNEEWKLDPARPAIMVGTIDMIGSKLLFSGYGDGRYKRAHHAGLIGKDTLIVHDEAHLTPAFSDLLRGIHAEQQRSNEARPIHVMELSATSRTGEEAGKFSLLPEDEEDTIVPLRVDASKELLLHEVEDKKAMHSMMVDRAFAHDSKNCKVVVFVTSPDDAQKVTDGLAAKLKKRKDHVALLTGTLRGHERDLLVAENKVFRAMLGHEQNDGTVYLVSTSAGEVGIDIDGDHMVSDLTTLDAFIQRLGRVNRRGGEGRKADVDLIALVAKDKKRSKSNEEKQEEAKAPSDPWSAALLATLNILRKRTRKAVAPDPSDAQQPHQEPVDTAAKGNTDSAPEHTEAEIKDVQPVPLWTEVPFNASPRNMRRLVEGLSEEERNRAFAPQGATRPLTDILLDCWSMTSIAGALPGRPEVAQYLHGVEASPPETHVVWRAEIQHLHDAALDNDQLGAWFQRCPLLVRERLRDTSKRVRSKLGELLGAHRKKARGYDAPVVLLDERGNAEWTKLSDVVNDKGPFSLEYRTVVLPASVGGLNASGMLDGKHLDPASDVGDELSEGDGGTRRERWILTEGPDEAAWSRLADDMRADALPKGLREKVRIPIAQAAEGLEDGEAKHLVLLVGRKTSATDNPETTSVEQTLKDHSKAIEEHATRMAEALGLDERLVRCLAIAAHCHDLGKARRVWQRYARNNDPSRPLAKALRYGRPDEMNGYRHEFGSLHDAKADPRFNELGKEEQDLVLHLIAAHHGWGRPHFDRRAWDHEAHGAHANQALFTEVMQCFGRLQLEHGRWGLAWLESLLRCADISASKEAVINEVEPQKAQA